MMKSGVPGDENDMLQNAFFYFVEALHRLSASPDAQCVLMQEGGIIPFDLKDDAACGFFLKDAPSLALSARQIQAISVLNTGLEALPLAAIDGRPFSKDSNRAAVEHSAWIPLRERAKSLLEDLAPAIAMNRKNLGLD